MATWKGTDLTRVAFDETNLGTHVESELGVRNRTAYVPIPPPLGRVFVFVVVSFCVADLEFGHPFAGYWMTERLSEFIAIRPWELEFYGLDYGLRVFNHDLESYHSHLSGLPVRAVVVQPVVMDIPTNPASSAAEAWPGASVLPRELGTMPDEFRHKQFRRVNFGQSDPNYSSRSQFLETYQGHVNRFGAPDDVVVICLSQSGGGRSLEPGYREPDRNDSSFKQYLQDHNVQLHHEGIHSERWLGTMGPVLSRIFAF